MVHTNITMLKKALFLDRDGIINVDHGYVSKINDFTFTKGIFELLHLFMKKEYLIFIITNQSGIGRGYYSVEDFQHLTDYMLNVFKEKDIHIQEVQYCPHAPEKNCHCRKPNTGMIEEILKAYPVDLSNSWLMGDKQSDIDLANQANIPHSIAIGTSDISGASYQFATISECYRFLKDNPSLRK